MIKYGVNMDLCPDVPKCPFIASVAFASVLSTKQSGHKGSFQDPKC